MRRLWTLVGVFALLAGMLAVPASATTGTLEWGGQGSTSADCDSYEEGVVHWIFQAGNGSTITSVTLYVPGEDSVTMELRGANNWSGYTGFGDGVVDEYGELSFPDDQPRVEYVGTVGRNPRLLVSGFCYEVPPTGSILLTKDYTVSPLSPAEFELWMGDAYVADIPLVMEGVYCIDDLPYGNYLVRESLVPEGFAPLGDQPVTVDAESTCADRLLMEPLLPDLELTNEASPVPLTVQKLKLSFAEGEFVMTDIPLAGFTFTVRDTEGDIATGVTRSDGLVDWGSGDTELLLEVPGWYEVCEVDTPHPGYWTTPASCQDFLASLNTPVNLTFYNAPKADVQIGFTDVTGYTSAYLACYDAEGALVAEQTLSGTGSLDLTQLDMGDYSCDVLIRNGAALPTD